MRAMVEPEQQHSQPEVTLGMASLLGIFFGLVILCGAFFGFGYSLGHRGAAPVPAPANTQANARPVAPGTLLPDTRDPGITNAPKPSADGPSTAGSYEDARPAEAPRANQSAHTPSAATFTATHAAKSQPVTADEILRAANSPARFVPDEPAPNDRPAVTTPTAQSSAPVLAVPGRAIMVQIAAISRPGDADALVAALRKHGYNVSARNEPQDKLLHVQIGPFTTRGEADTMRQKLLADGYNAIEK